MVKSEGYYTRRHFWCKFMLKYEVDSVRELSARTIYINKGAAQRGLYQIYR